MHHFWSEFSCPSLFPFLGSVPAAHLKDDLTRFRADTMTCCGRQPIERQRAMANVFDDFILKLGVSADSLPAGDGDGAAALAEQGASGAGEDTTTPNGGSNLSSGTAAKPTIAVKASGTIFTVTGSGFLASSSVSVRTTQILPGQVVDLRTPTSSDANGNIAIDIAGPNVCAVVGPIFFSATDGREDKSDRLGVLFSNAVEMSCLPLAPPDKPDYRNRQTNGTATELRSPGSVVERIMRQEN